MSKPPILTTEAGAAVPDNQHSQTVGPSGPVLLQDHHLIEKLARFNRERIPERVVHAVGTGAHGYFEVTSPEAAKWTSMKVFSQVGKRTEVFAPFSTVAGSKGAADLARDPRGFALKFYTEDGNWDLAGNNTPVFFIRDGIKFPDFISRSPTTSGTSSRTHPRRRTSSPGSSGIAASRRPIARWTASAPTRSSGSTLRASGSG